jgi:hypothetical protein
MPDAGAGEIESGAGEAGDDRGFLGRRHLPPLLDLTTLDFDRRVGAEGLHASPDYTGRRVSPSDLLEADRLKGGGLRPDVGLKLPRGCGASSVSGRGVKRLLLRPSVSDKPKKTKTARLSMLEAAAANRLQGGMLEEHVPFLPAFADGILSARLTLEIAHGVVAKEPEWTALLFPPVSVGASGNESQQPGADRRVRGRARRDRTRGPNVSYRLAGSHDCIVEYADVVG